MIGSVCLVDYTHAIPNPILYSYAAKIMRVWLYKYAVRARVKAMKQGTHDSSTSKKQKCERAEQSLEFFTYENRVQPVLQDLLMMATEMATAFNSRTISTDPW